MHTQFGGDTDTCPYRHKVQSCVDYNLLNARRSSELSWIETLVKQMSKKSDLTMIPRLGSCNGMYFSCENRSQT